MRNEDKWHPNEDAPIDPDDDQSERLIARGVIGAFSGLLILCAIVSMAGNQILRY